MTQNHLKLEKKTKKKRRKKVKKKMCSDAGLEPTGGQGGCERRIEVIVKMQKKIRGGGGGGGGGGGVEGGGWLVARLGVRGDVGYVNQE